MIDQLSEQFFATLLEAQPTWAHMIGELEHAGSYEDASRAAEDLFVNKMRAFALRANEVPTDDLDEQQKITRLVLEWTATAYADMTETRLSEITADPIFGQQAQLPLVLGMLSVPDAEAADAMVGKFEGIGAHFADLADRLREGAARDRFPAAFAVDGTVAQLDALLATPVADDPMVAAVRAPEGIDVEAWRGRLAEVVEKVVRPGIQAYADVLRDEIRPHARPDDKVGLSWLPDGEAAYNAALRFYNTTSLTAEEIHEIGLRQIASLADEYRALGPEVTGSDDLDEILAALRSDPALHAKSGDELVEASKVAMRRAEKALPDWFAVLPKAPCAVEPTTAGAKAFYFPPSGDGSRGGTFFVNVTEPESWGLFELESLAFHEGVPGHHLQLAIAAELEDIPKFRKHVHNSGYAEGWGLYTERLSDEMGLYSSALDRMGMYSADSMRACRLVVDTGLHAMGWSRQQAVDFMVANSPLTEGVVRPEVDRYVVAPGQATSYMVGRLEIQRMRREAEARGGFDIKQFHSAVLDSGSLPLDVLDAVVKARMPGA